MNDRKQGDKVVLMKKESHLFHVPCHKNNNQRPCKSLIFI